MQALDPTPVPTVAAPRLLLVCHSRSGRTEQLQASIRRGIDQVDGVQCTVQRAELAGIDDVRMAQGYLFGTPENFGSMSGMFKDFLERIYYPLQDQIAGRPFGLFVACGNDGLGAVEATRRILRGLQLKEVQPPLIWREPAPFPQQAAEELGQTMALGLQHQLW